MNKFTDIYQNSNIYFWSTQWLDALQPADYCLWQWWHWSLTHIHTHTHIYIHISLGLNELRQIEFSAGTLSIDSYHIVFRQGPVKCTTVPVAMTTCTSYIYTETQAGPSEFKIFVAHQIHQVKLSANDIDGFLIMSAPYVRIIHWPCMVNYAQFPWNVMKYENKQSWIFTTEKYHCWLVVLMSGHGFLKILNITWEFICITKERVTWFRVNKYINTTDWVLCYNHFSIKPMAKCKNVRSPSLVPKTWHNFQTHYTE